MLFAGTLCCFNACEKPSPVNPSGAFNVELVIPFQMEVNTTDMLYTFDVRNGKALSVTKLSSAYDPLHAVSYTAKRTNSNSSISFPTSKTKHMFRVQASTANSTLNIMVTDRFGNVYTETMTRPKAFTTDAYKTY